MTIGLDKKLHFLGCFSIAALIHMFTGDVWTPSIIAAVVGVAKEVWDSRNPLNYFSWLDLLADGLGILLFVCAYYLSSLV